MLSKPLDRESLSLYLVVSNTVVSTVLIIEDGKVQWLVYYVSRTLQYAEIRYPMIKKLALALINTVQKLRPYFQCHPIIVVSTFPFRAVLHKLEVSGRLTI